MTLCFPMPGIPQYLSYLSVVGSLNWNTKIVLLNALDISMRYPLHCSRKWLHTTF